MRGLLVLGLGLLGGCSSYNCGDYVVEHPDVAFEAGEWCGLFGSYGFEDPTAQTAQIIVSPDAADDETFQLVLNHLAITDVRFPLELLEPGTTFTLDDGATAVCGIAPEGAGSGSLIFPEAEELTIDIGAESSKELTGGRSFRVDWDVTCPYTHTTGSDLVELTEGSI